VSDTLSPRGELRECLPTNRSSESALLDRAQKELLLVPRGGLSLGPFNRSKINNLAPAKMPALYQANVPMSTVK